MFSNYLKLAFRNLRRHGWYVMINVAGLGIAFGFTILSFLNHRYAGSYDAWHPGKERIFRVEVVKEGNGLLHGVCPAPLGPAVAGSLGAVEASTSIDGRGTVVKYGDHIFNERLHFVSGNFLQFFRFPLKTGQDNLDDRNVVLITESTARKYFGSENPIGKVLIFNADSDDRFNLRVGGILQDVPKNSSVHFDFVTHLDNQREENKPVDYTNWRYFMDATFLRLKSPKDAVAVTEAIQQYTAVQNTGNPDWKVKSFVLDPLPEVAGHSREIRWNNLWSGMPPAADWGNLILAALLLLTACLNFTNMTIAGSTGRLREMGMRKVMGGTQKQLILQLLTESLLVCLAGLLIGMVLEYPILDWYNRTWKFCNLQVDYLHDAAMMAFLIAIVVGTTLLAGAYPAFYISGFKPSIIFNGTLRFGGSNLFSRLMLGLQVAISLISVVVGVSFARNAAFDREADIGYDRDHIIGVHVSDEQEYNLMANAAKEIPAVQAVCGSVHVPGFSYRFREFSYQGNRHEAAWYDVGDQFVGLMNIRLLSGENFSGKTSDGVPTVLVNEKFALEIAGNKPVAGDLITLDSVTYRIAGVVKDFMTDTPFNPLSPVVLRQTMPSRYQYCMIRAESKDLNAVFDRLETNWKTLFPFKPFNGFYQSQTIREALEASENIARSMYFFSLVTILFTIAGLFSLTSLNILKRMREIAIRRVMGARAGNIAYLLNKNYIWIFGLALLTGSLGGRFLALTMMNSIFKINAGVQPGALAVSAFGIIFIAASTIGVKIWQTLRLNPSDVLRGD
jgi:hypothetical protein